LIASFFLCVCSQSLSDLQNINSAISRERHESEWLVNREKNRVNFIQLRLKSNNGIISCASLYWVWYL